LRTGAKAVFWLVSGGVGLLPPRVPGWQLEPACCQHRPTTRSAFARRSLIIVISIVVISIVVISIVIIIIIISLIIIIIITIIIIIIGVGVVGAVGFKLASAPALRFWHDHLCHSERHSGGYLAARRV
jgi:hypothetical protein